MADKEEKKGEDLKKKLEADGLTQLKALQKEKGLIPPADDLSAIMQAGADKFKAEMGRNMSYGEMRDMYG